MQNLISLGVLVSSIWVGFDAKKLGVRKGSLNGGFFDLGAGGWFIACLLIWIVAFPAYMMKRDTYKRLAANAQGGAAGASQSGAAAIQQASNVDALAQIEKLAQLKANGVITEEEFARKKEQQLG